jgi:hypothetical protein
MSDTSSAPPPLRVQPADELTPSLTTAAGVMVLKECGYWFCGRCGSVIPVRFWHTCDETSARSGVHEDRKA